MTALLHDFDYEIHPTLDKHPQDGAPILREEGYPEEVIEGVLSHAKHLGLPRDTPLKKTLFACDELSGFVHACGLVRPTGLEALEPKSVRKKLKQPSFAAGVHRDDVYRARSCSSSTSTSTSQRRRGAAADRRRARAPCEPVARGQGSRLSSARGDVVRQVPDLGALLRRLELDDVADRDQADHLTLLDHREVTDPPLGDDRHALVDRRRGRHDDQRRGHDLAHARVPIWPVSSRRTRRR